MLCQGSQPIRGNLDFAHMKLVLDLAHAEVYHEATNSVLNSLSVGNETSNVCAGMAVGKGCEEDAHLDEHCYMSI